MTITIDISPAANGKAGLGRYAHALTRALSDQSPDNVHLFANLAEGAHIPSDLSDLPRTTIQMGYKGWRMAVLMGQIATLRFDKLLPRSTKLFHATEHLLFPTRRIPTVLTVHDLIFKLFPEYHKRLNYWYLNAAMPIFAKRADHVIAVSESTKRDLITHYKLPPEKITVIYEAAAPHFKPQSSEAIQAVKAKYSLPDQYLVTVGTIEPRKNLARLVEALAVLRNDWPSLHLVVVGSDGWMTDYFYDTLRDLEAGEAVRQPGYVPDADLPALMAGAACSVTPSLYEGFGLPVLEAMATGVPVVCSNRSSLPELAGDAALTFDPESVPEMVQAVSRILSDRSYAQTAVQQGLQRVAAFTWQKAAAQTWAVYQNLLQQDTGTGSLRSHR